MFNASIPECFFPRKMLCELYDSLVLASYSTDVEASDGDSEGNWDGNKDGNSEGWPEGAGVHLDGNKEGIAVGSVEGDEEGS